MDSRYQYLSRKQNPYFNLSKRVIKVMHIHVYGILIFVTFLCGILGQVWYLIVWIPDLCRLSYFESNQQWTKFIFGLEQEIDLSNVKFE